MVFKEIIDNLKKGSNPKNVAGMARFGINPKNTLGVPIPILRKLAKEIGKDPTCAKDSVDRHKLALELWDSGIHEAQILASMVDEVEKVTPSQMDAWVQDFDSWDVCDQVCMNLFCRLPNAAKKCFEWARRQPEFERRASFALIACLAFKNKSLKDKDFVKFFPLIKKYSTDERNYVRKAVNWALRQIGKRNLALNGMAVLETKKIAKINSKSASWIAADALRELKSEAIQNKLKK